MGEADQRQPYGIIYVHRLVGLGWDNLSDLDAYPRTAPAQQDGLIVSVLDIENGIDGLKKRARPDLRNEDELKDFLQKHSILLR